MHKKYLLVILLSIGISSILFYFLRKTNSVVHKKHRLTIICTTGMITNAVKTIAGDDAIVYGLMGPGIDPHLYRARESDVSRLANADIIFYNGLHLEGKMSDLFAKMSSTKTTVGLADTIPKSMLIPSDISGHYDPHIWFDVTLWTMVVNHIAQVLCEFDAKTCPQFKNRAEQYIQKLKDLDQYVEQQIRKIPKKNRILITAHDAFEYLGKRYGLEVRGLQGMSTESEAGTKDVQELVNFVVQKRIPAIFVESSIPQRTLKAVQEAARAQGWNVAIGDELYSDALGTAGKPAGTYLGMVKANVDAIVRELK